MKFKKILCISTSFLLLSSLKSNAYLPIEKDTCVSSSNTNIKEDKKIKNLKSEIINYCKKYDKNGVSVSFYYKDITTSNSICYNISKKFDPASTNKTFLALCVFDMIEKGELKLEEELTYQKHHFYGGTGEIKNCKIGRKYKIQELLRLLITKSDNIASRILKERITETKLKKYLSSIGTPAETKLTANQAFSSLDLSKHMTALYDFISKETELSEKAKIYFMSGIYNDKIPQGIPKNLSILHKPGWIPAKLVCNDEAIIYDENGNPYILVIMSKGIKLNNQCEFFKTLTSKIHEYHKITSSISKNEEKNMNISK